MRCTPWPTRYRSGSAAHAGGRTASTYDCVPNYTAAPWSSGDVSISHGCRVGRMCWRCSARSTPRSRHGNTGKTTVDRLHQLTARGWRPQDCLAIDDYRAQLERWVLTAAELLAEHPRVFLHVACPRCGARTAYRTDSGGEQVRSWALRVSENGCKCSACGAFWPSDRFEWLAWLLGCEGWEALVPSPYRAPFTQVIAQSHPLPQRRLAVRTTLGDFQISVPA